MAAPSTPPIARYRVESVLGSGGMGVVSAAFDTVRGHDVALKRLSVERFPAQRDLQQSTALFEREYYTLAQLAHPHIIAVYDYGLDEEGPYYTMERLHGQSLRELSPLDAAPACSLARDVSSALAIVHSRRLVHRDVTSLNVLRTPEGRAKLIDFGAMMPMGVPKNVVGTAPFVAPECLAFQELDERVDLYSLGACLYFALTGRHAYRAHGLRELPDAWRRAPAPPSMLAPRIPAALDQLVMALLSLKPAGRPSSAAEVFERLTAIAELPRAEQPDVARAYVTTPALVGREPALGTLRRRALKASRQRGSSVTIEGAAGVGRSRLQDAGVLAARLSGLRVARADGSDGLTAFGAARRLLGAFLEGSAKGERRAAAAGLAGFIRGEEPPSRDQVLGDGVAFVLDECKKRPTAVVVDDLHLIDEPSLAFVAGLSARTRNHGLFLLTTVDSGARSASAAALSLVLESSHRISIGPLDEPSSRALLSSLFGEPPGIDTLGAVTYRRYRGNPRDSMDAAQRLIDRKLVRYEGGSWLITGDPDVIEAALPADDTLNEVLDGLSPDAAELLAVLSLDRDVVMCLADYPSLASEGDTGRVNRALDELIQAKLVLPAGDRHPFRREGHRLGVVSRLDESRRRELHRRLAERASLLSVPRVYEAFHFLKAGLWERAVPAIEHYRDFVEHEPQAEIIRNPITLEMLEEILALPEEPGNRALRAEHGAGLVMNAIYQGSPERAVPHIRGVLQSLSWFTGLGDHDALGAVEPGARLGRMMGLAQARCEAAGLPSLNPITATRRLSQASLATATCAYFMADPELLAVIPDLTPLVPLSPAIGVASTLVGALTDLVRGRTWEAWDTMKAVREELRGPLASALDPLTRMGLERVTLAFLCALEAERAHADAPGHIEEYAPFMPNLAESHRARYCLAMGDVSGAALSRRRSEVLSVRAGSLADAHVVELPGHLSLYALSDDLMGITRTLDAMRDVALARPGWKPRVELARAHFHRCRGEIEEALAIIEASLSEHGDRHGDFARSAAAHVDLLNRAGRFEDARQAGRGHLERARAARVPTILLDLALASSAAELGDATEAERRFDAARSTLQGRGIAGVHLGHCYEIGARIALVRGDREIFAQRAVACAERYAAGDAPSLTAKYDALMAWARARDFSEEGAPGLATSASNEARTEAAELRTGPSADVSTSIESTGPHHEVLAALVERAGAKGGFLYAKGAEGLERTGRTPGFDPPDHLDDVVRTFYAANVEPESPAITMTTVDAPRAGRDDGRLCTPAGDPLVPWLLEYFRHGTRFVRGVAVLALPDAHARVPAEAITAAAMALAARVGATSTKGVD